MEETPAAPLDDTYAYQREELMALLRRLSRDNEPLVVHGQARLSSDEATRILHKIRQGYAFSRRERAALAEAVFDLDRVFPSLA